MRGRQIAAVLCGLAACWVLEPGLNATAAASGLGASLLRTTLTVADVDRSRAFYALLGFEAENEMGGSRDPESAFPLNSRSSRWRLVILANDTGAGGKIGLLSFDEASPEPVRDMQRERIGLGDMVFVFDVPDARATHARLVGAGADIVEEPVSYRSAQLDEQGGPMAGWVFHVFDPDGYLIEILEAPRPVRP